MIRLRIAVKAQRKRSERAEMQVRSERALAEANIIRLIGSAVLAPVIEVPPACKNLAVGPDFPPNHQVGGSMLRACLRVHAAPLVLRHQNISVRVKHVAAERRLPFAFLSARPK